jgi:hypothetical protein
VQKDNKVDHTGESFGWFTVWTKLGRWRFLALQTTRLPEARPAAA